MWGDYRNLATDSSKAVLKALIFVFLAPHLCSLILRFYLQVIACWYLAKQLISAYFSFCWGHLECPLHFAVFLRLPGISVPPHPSTTDYYGYSSFPSTMRTFHCFFGLSACCDLNFRLSSSGCVRKAVAALRSFWLWSSYLRVVAWFVGFCAFLKRGDRENLVFLNVGLSHSHYQRFSCLG